jgi:molybdenum cofactor cytidylyltransferase
MNMTGLSHPFCAIILAAGLSRRMGRPKMTLPWGKTTVIGQIVSVFKENGVNRTTVVTGGASFQVEMALKESGAQIVFNPEHADGNMLTSLKYGLRSQPVDSEAVFIALGDQPFIDSGVVKLLMREYIEQPALILVPSFQMRRGHPWLVRRDLWDDVLSLPAEATMRDFLSGHSDDIRYVLVNTPTVVEDMDTPEEYEKVKPENGGL